MAVYTALSQEEILAALAPFGLGRLVRSEAVAAGIENTTYFLIFESASGHRAEYVLTLGESIGTSDMRFVAGLTTTLAQHGLPVPAPVTAKEGTSIVQLAHKPALLMPKAPGSPPLLASAQQCHAIGSALAKIHRVTSSLPIAHASHKSLEWVADTGRVLLPHLPAGSRQLLDTALAGLHAFASTYEELPRGIIHGDLFRDNSLFEDGHLTAIIDFFSAGDGYFLFDLAVAANDWCIAGPDSLDSEKLAALLSGYCEVRPPTSLERQCWGEMLAIAALRFWVSRLADRYFPSPDRTSHPTKDPAPYEKLWVLHSTQRQSLDFTPQ